MADTFRGFLVDIWPKGNRDAARHYSLSEADGILTASQAAAAVLSADRAGRWLWDGGRVVIDVRPILLGGGEE